MWVNDVFMLAVADIGGTNSRFALFSVNRDRFFIENEINKITNDYNSIEDMLLNVCEEDRRYEDSRFVIAVPGAVTSDSLIHLPYVRWGIDKIKLNRKYPDVVCINDFTAQAYGCLTKAVSNAYLLTGKEGESSKDIAIVGAGTGTGHCALKKTENLYVCVSSEAGHIPFNFLFEDENETGYRNFLISKNIKSPVCNDVVSGPGLSRLHEFFTGRDLSANEVISEISPDSQTTKYFAKFYGRACRNYALSTLASGGRLYISGGVAIKNQFLVNNDNFRREFLLSETTAKELLRQISVYLVRDERIGLFGAAYYGAYIV